jgi:hypothetical protein
MAAAGKAMSGTQPTTAVPRRFGLEIKRADAPTELNAASFSPATASNKMDRANQL